MPFAMRPMHITDIPQVSEIDRECFPTQWPPPYRRDLLYGNSVYYLVCYEENDGERASEDGAQGPPITEMPHRARLWHRLTHLFSPGRDTPPPPGQRLVGVVGLWIMAGEAHITTIGVRNAYRRQGLGELLLISIIELATGNGARVVTLEVRASNSVALELYEKYGFRRVGVRKGYYTDNREDAIIMTTDEVTSASFQGQYQRAKDAHAQRWGLAHC